MWIPDGNSIWNDGIYIIPYRFQVEWNDQNGWDISQIRTVIFTTFCIVKEIPPTSRDFYDKICIKKF